MKRETAEARKAKSKADDCKLPSNEDFIREAACAMTKLSSIARAHSSEPAAESAASSGKSLNDFALEKKDDQRAKAASKPKELTTCISLPCSHLLKDLEKEALKRKRQKGSEESSIGKAC